MAQLSRIKMASLRWNSPDRFLKGSPGHKVREKAQARRVAGSLSSPAEMVPPPGTPPIVLMIPAGVVETDGSAEIKSLVCIKVGITPSKG
jgi:hypothetical protein